MPVCLENIMVYTNQPILQGSNSTVIYYFMTAWQSLARVPVRSAELIDASLCSLYSDRLNKDYIYI